MAENSAISWTHHTQNFWLGCDKVAPECAHCYIDRAMLRLGHQPWGAIHRTSEALWKNPFKWEKKAAARGKSLRIFTCSESDFFHDKADAWRPEAWEMIKATPHLVWQILTKRPGRIKTHLPGDWGEGYPNCWLGVTSGCRNTLGLMNVLRDVPAAVRFVSAEPLLEPVHDEINLSGFAWLITGGESGAGPEYVWISGTHFSKEPSGRRTMLLSWANQLRLKCESVGTAFYFKQITAFRSGQGAAALGQHCHNYPAGPFPWYSAQELSADFRCRKTTSQGAKRAEPPRKPDPQKKFF